MRFLECTAKYNWNRLNNKLGETIENSKIVETYFKG